MVGCDVDSVRGRVTYDSKRRFIGIDEDDNIFVLYGIERHLYVRCWVDLFNFIDDSLNQESLFMAEFHGQSLPESWQ